MMKQQNRHDTTSAHPPIPALQTDVYSIRFSEGNHTMYTRNPEFTRSNLIHVIMFLNSKKICYCQASAVDLNKACRIDVMQFHGNNISLWC